MSKQQTAVEWQHIELSKFLHGKSEFTDAHDILIKAKEMQQEQAQLYATFVLMCVNNNLPPITFNDWVGNIRN